MGARIRAYDWASTPLGPIETWPQGLKVAVTIALDSAFPGFIWWGPELIQLYNDAALAIVRAKHPESLGVPARESWSEIWETIGPLLEGVLSTGEAVIGEDFELLPDRGGPLEPAYFTFSYSALRDETGTVVGVVSTAIETTAEVRADAARREMEARLELAVEIGGLGHWELDLGTGAFTTSPLCRSNFGRDREEPFSYDDLLATIHPNDRERQARAVAAATEARSGFDIQYRILTPSGEPRHIEVRGRYEGTAGRDRLVGVSLDITQSKRIEDALREREERLAGQKEAFQAALYGEPLETSLGALVRMAVEQAGDDARCAFYIANAERTELRHVIGMPEAYSRCIDGFKIGPDALACGLAVYTGTPVITPDVTEDPLWKDWLWLAEEFRYRAVWSFPVETSAGKVVGTFAMYHPEPRDAAPRDHELAATMTRAAAIIISRDQEAEERARAEAALSASEENYRLLFNSIDEGFCLIEMLFDAAGKACDYRFLQVNPAFERQTGLAGAVGRTIREMAPEHEESWYEIYGRIALTGAPARFQNRAEALGHWYDVYAFRVGQPEERRVAVLFQDIAERKEAEEALRESEERQAFLLKLSDALRPFADPVEVMTVASEALGRHLGVGRCGYGEVDATGEFFTVEREWTDGVMASFKGRHRLVDFGPEFTAAYRAGQTVLINDALADVRAQGAEAAFEAAGGVRASLGVPLIKEGRFVAGLFVQQLSPRQWSAEEEVLALEVAERTWAAVERARAEAALQVSEARFRHIVENARDYAIFTADAEGIVTDWYEGAEAVFGYAADEIVGRNARILFTPEDRAAGEVEKELETARNEGSAPNIRWHLRNDGARVFIEGRTVALRDGGGELRGYLKIGQDLTERRRAEQALHESEERFRQFGAASNEILWVRNAETLQFEYVSRAFEAIYGTAPDEMMSRNDLRGWAEMIHPDDRDEVLENLRAVRGGERVTHESRILRADGEVRWIRNTDFPLFDEDSRVQRVAGIGQDVTEQRRVEEQVRLAQDRLRALVEGIPQLVWQGVGSGEWTSASPQWTDYTGLSEEASRGFGWLEAVHPDDRRQTMAAWAEAEASQHFDVEYRVHHSGEDRYRWFQTRATPVRVDGGHVVEWFGTSTDIDDLRRLQDEQKVLVAELQHRSRNLLAVVRSTAGKTLTPGVEVEEFGGRLAALSRVQGFLARSDGFSAELGEIVRAEIEAHGDGANVRIEGPAIELPGEKAQPFALAVHELATNAVKYGALSTETGRLEVTWRIEGADGGTRQLVLDWKETGVVNPPPQAAEASAAPRRKGYGRELIERALPYQLGAQTHLEFAEEGVRSSIKVPLTALSSRKG